MPLILLPFLSSWPRRAAVLSLAVLLAGCASLAPQAVPEAGPPLVRQYHDSITLAGRMSLRYTQYDREQAVHGSFTWDQQNDHTVLSLLSPLGQTLAVIDIRPDMAVLRQSDKAPLSAPNVDVLMSQALGWPLPVAGLRDWLQGFGRDATGQNFIAQPSAEPLNFVTRDGWHLSYGEWLDEGANTTRNRPKRIDLNRDTERAGPVSIRIVIDQWQLPGAATPKP